MHNAKVRQDDNDEVPPHEVSDSGKEDSNSCKALLTAHVIVNHVDASSAEKSYLLFVTMVEALQTTIRYVEVIAGDVFSTPSNYVVSRAVVSPS